MKDSPIEAGMDTYAIELGKWRERYEHGLRAEHSWLAITGLHWLEEGENTVGVSDDNDIVVDCSSGPGSLGTFTLADGQISFLPSPGAAAENRELAALEGAVDLGEHGSSRRVRFGDCSLVVLRRGDQYGIRVYDARSPRRLEFGGVHWFPIDKALRVIAEFRPYAERRLVPMLNILGQVSEVEVPGELHFELFGERQLLLPTVGNDGFFLVFKDGTSGAQTYGAARFLMTERPVGDAVTLDFNKAYHPPCAHTPFATCPLPFPENLLTVSVTAGERLP